MALSLKQLLALGILASSSSVFASTHTANFSAVNSANTSYSFFDYSVDGVDVHVTAWSDTQNNLPNDDTELEAASLVRYGTGWGVVNQDESGNASPDHSMDNMGNWVDYDMILVSFSEAVTLTGASFSWLYNTSQSEISVAAISGAVASGLGGSTWSDVVNSAGNMWSDSSHVSNYYAGISAGQTASQYWLVGAYNSIFNTNFSGGTDNNDGVKLSSLDFSIAPPPSTEVAEPQTVFVIILGLFAMMISRRKRAL
jgi:hypothetical protein